MIFCCFLPMWGMLILLEFFVGEHFGLQDFAKYLTPSIGAMNACLAIHNQFYGKKIQKIVCISIITQNQTRCLCFVPFGSFSGFWAFDQQSMTLSDANLSIFSKLVQSTPYKKTPSVCHGEFSSFNVLFTNKQNNNQKRWICGDTNDRFQEQQFINSWWTHWFLLAAWQRWILGNSNGHLFRFPNQNRCFQKPRKKSWNLLKKKIPPYFQW